MASCDVDRKSAQKTIRKKVKIIIVIKTTISPNRIRFGNLSNVPIILNPFLFRPKDAYLGFNIRNWSEINIQ